MAKDILQYNQMVEDALRSVVRRAVSEVAEDGLPGNHHFYITFRTGYPGVDIAEHLKARYPGEMTIVLQYQFYDLTVDDEGFSVTLTFSNVPERLVIPFHAITVFADPSVNFALPLHPPEAEIVEAVAKPAATAVPVKTKGKAAKDTDKDTDKGGGEVVSLDTFRRK